VKRLNIALNTNVATINTPIQAALLLDVKLEEPEEEREEEPEEELSLYNA
jgi:hypothetical protein